MAKMKVSMHTPGKPMANQYFTIDAAGVTAKENRLKVCMAAATVLVERLKTHLEKTTNDANAAVRGTLAKSLTLKSNADGSVTVGPAGKHHGTGVGPKTRAAGYHRPRKGAGVSAGRKRHGMANAVSAVDVGYYLEYGSPRMAAEHWMELTLENSEEELLNIMEAEWNKILESHGL